MIAQTALTMKTGLAAGLPVPRGRGGATYVQSANEYPVLSLEEEQAFARRFRETNDLEAARALILSHLRLVVAVARGYLGYGLPQSDLIQEGNIGLMKSVNRFDPDRGVRLSAFAMHWIKAEIHEYVLRNWRLVKIASTKAQRKLFFNLRSMKRGLGTLSGSDIHRIAGSLNVKPHEVTEMEVRMTGHEIAFDIQDDEDTLDPVHFLADPRNGPCRMLESEETNRLRDFALKSAIGSLDARSRRIIETRWLREQDQSTLHDLAAEFGVSAERIRQIEVKALQEMKKAMNAGGVHSATM